MPSFPNDAPVAPVVPVAAVVPAAAVLPVVPVVTVLMGDGSEVIIPTPGSIKSEHGAQNHLTGHARAAARGALHGDVVSNTIARDAAISRGEAADGFTVDGSTQDGRAQPDVADGSDQATFGAPGTGEGRLGLKPDTDAIVTQTKV